MQRTTSQGRVRSYFIALLACVLTAAVAGPLQYMLDVPNIVMLFLLTVFLVAWKLGRGPALMAAFLSVALFDFFFVPPHLSFAVSDVQYLVTFVVMLAVGLITAQLTAGLHRQAEIAAQQERQARGLYELARELAGAVSREQVQTAVNAYLKGDGLAATLHLLDEGEALPLLRADPLSSNLARLAMDRGEPVEADALGVPTLFLPLKAPMRTRGVITVTERDPTAASLQGDRALLMTVASLVAIAIERLHYVDVLQTTELQVSSERLRSSVLSALSHDLRTPLAALVGMADSLAVAQETGANAGREMACAIRDQARALSNLLGNLLDMARLSAGKVELHKEWQLFEDVIGASLRLIEPALTQRPIKVTLERNLPLVEFDAVLLERVVCNLIENAAKYSAAGSPIEVRAFVQDDSACIEVCDQGPGFPADRVERLFEMFVRGAPESATPGVGLGLAICRAIVDAHQGTIAASNQPAGGACVTVRLPLGTPPAIEVEEDSVSRQPS
jgi:two-component system sensor histidine kinase KdpD